MERCADSLSTPSPLEVEKEQRMGALGVHRDVQVYFGRWQSHSWTGQEFSLVQSGNKGAVGGDGSAAHCSPQSVGAYGLVA